jgi:hypothetical protein
MLPQSPSELCERASPAAKREMRDPKHETRFYVTHAYHSSGHGKCVVDYRRSACITTCPDFAQAKSVPYLYGIGKTSS